MVNTQVQVSLDSAKNNELCESMPPSLLIYLFHFVTPGYWLVLHLISYMYTQIQREVSANE